MQVAYSPPPITISPAKKKEEEPVKIAAPQIEVAARAPPPRRDPEIVEHEVPVYKEVPVPVETIVPRSV